MAKIIIEVDTRDIREIQKAIRALIALITPPKVEPEKEKKVARS